MPGAQQGQTEEHQMPFATLAGGPQILIWKGIDLYPEAAQIKGWTFSI